MTTKFLCASFVVLAAVCASSGQGADPTPTPVKLVITSTISRARLAPTPGSTRPPVDSSESTDPEPTPTPVKLVVTDKMPAGRVFSAPAPKPTATPIIVASAARTVSPTAEINSDQNDGRSIPASYSGRV